MGARDDNAQLIPRATRVVTLLDGVSITGLSELDSPILDVGGYSKATVFTKLNRTAGSGVPTGDCRLSPLGGDDFEDLMINLVNYSLGVDTVEAKPFQGYEPAFSKGKFARLEIREIGDAEGTVDAYVVLQP
jgi:hypothetical protein